MCIDMCECVHQIVVCMYTHVCWMVVCIYVHTCTSKTCTMCIVISVDWAAVYVCTCTLYKKVNMLEIALPCIWIHEMPCVS